MSWATRVQFLQNTVAYLKSLGVRAKRVLTDNRSAFRSKLFAAACRDLGLKHSFTRPYRPQTNGKAERFIQSALREWAYGVPYNHSSERTAMLERWTHHYNWHRPHQGIKGIASSATHSSHADLAFGHGHSPLQNRGQDELAFVDNESHINVRAEPTA